VADEGSEEEGTQSDTPRPSTSYYDVMRPRSTKPVRELPGLIARALRLVWRAGRANTVVLGIIAIAQAAIAVLQLALVRRILTDLPTLSVRAPVRDTLPELAFFAAIFTLQSIASFIDSQLRQVLGEQVARYSQSMVADSAASVGLLDYERPAFHDRLQRALTNAATRPLQLTFAVVTLATSVATVVGILAILARVLPILLPAVLLAFGPAWFAVHRMTRLGFDFSVAESHEDRKRSYFLSVLVSKPLATELRSYDLHEEIERRHAELWDGRLDRLRRLTRRRIRIGVLGRLLNGALLGLVLAAVAWSLSSGRSSVAEAGTVAGALFLLTQRLTALVSSVGTLYECALFIEDVEDFLDVEQAQTRKLPTGDIDDELEELRAEQVVFTYPAGIRPALDKASISVRAGEMIALVGPNGSGKSTLVKVIASLYPPSSGDVTWNGVASSTVAPRAWRSHIAVVFQDFARYLLSLEENVGFGNVTSMNDEAGLRSALAAAGGDGFLESLPDGMHTLLGPEFIGGTDLSAGQWQRVALARAFFRRASLLILDEPTASLDPEAEAHLFDQIQETARDKAVIVISHRLSSVVRADRIYLLDRGRVVEVGTHAELLRARGHYANLFALQARAYNETPPGEVLPD
jgi:ATP-binding cassette, subfamily B, bacterial